MNATNQHQCQQKQWRARFEECLAKLWQDKEIKELIQSEHLLSSMQYATTGGKRLRALLVYASNQLFSGDCTSADAYALALELFHAFSLVHDDLPAIDNDDLRRGAPSCHRAFDEATAIIAGDTLHALAFHLLVRASSVLEPSYAVLAQTHFTRATLAVMSGQMQDIYYQELFVCDDPQAYEQMCVQKTAALFEASLALGALSAESNEAVKLLPQLQQLGRALGLAFQLQDDVLDIESTSEQLGKQIGSDEKNNKPTLAAHNLAHTKNRVALLFDEIHGALVTHGWQTSQLAEIISAMQHRDR